MSEKRIDVRIPKKVGNKLKREIYKHGHHEYVVFALCSHAVTADGVLIFVKEIVTLQENQYVDSELHGAMWRGSSTIDIINLAIEKKLGIFLFHSHMHKGQVGLSGDDLQSANQLLPCYQNLIPERPHGSIVLGYESMAGVVLMPYEDNFKEVTSVRWIDKVLVDWNKNYLLWKKKPVNLIYENQALLIGGKAQEKLWESKVAVIGLSGGGSHVVQQLAHLGIGEIIGIDDDLGEKGNQHRLIGITDRDVNLKRRKTDIMKKLVKKINKKIKFTSVFHRIPEQEAIEQLKRADIVVGCVDSLMARADIHELCQRYLIPYIDIGLLIRPTDDEFRSSVIGGNVFITIPGSICMYCNGFLSEERLSNETNGKPRSYFEGTDKQAQVVSFNGILASAAVNEVLQMITGFAPIDEDVYTIKKFDGLKNTLSEWILNPNPKCSSCLNDVANGDAVWNTVNFKYSS